MGAEGFFRGILAFSAPLWTLSPHFFGSPASPQTLFLSLHAHCTVTIARAPQIDGFFPLKSVCIPLRHTVALSTINETKTKSWL